jgi:indole-3-acetate monooxygenase
MMFFPTREVEIIDTWRVSGLRGTGSQDYRVTDLFVPEERSIGGFGDAAVQPGVLYALPLITVFATSIAAVPLGIAQASIDALIDLAQSKTPTGSPALLRDKPMIQSEIGRAEAMLRSARAFLFESVQQLWDEAEAGNLSLQRRAAVRLACAQVAATAKEVTPRMFDAGGGTALYESGPLERCSRDAQAAAQHITVSGNNFELAGRVVLGLDPGTPRF